MADLSARVQARDRSLEPRLSSLCCCVLGRIVPPPTRKFLRWLMQAARADVERRDAVNAALRGELLQARSREKIRGKKSDGRRGDRQPQSGWNLPTAASYSPPTRKYAPTPHFPYPPAYAHLPTPAALQYEHTHPNPRFPHAHLPTPAALQYEVAIINTHQTPNPNTHQNPRFPHAHLPTPAALQYEAGAAALLADPAAVGAREAAEFQTARVKLNCLIRLICAFELNSKVQLLPAPSVRLAADDGGS